MRRWLLGMIAVVLLAAWPILYWQQQPFLAGVSLRIGLVLGALWLALPQLQESSRWLYRAAIGAAIVVAAFSHYALLLVPLLVVLLFLKPRAGVKEPRSHSGTERS